MEKSVDQPFVHRTPNKSIPGQEDLLEEGQNSFGHYVSEIYGECYVRRTRLGSAEGTDKSFKALIRFREIWMQDMLDWIRQGTRLGEGMSSPSAKHSISN
jgi:hypothetical protein